MARCQPTLLTSMCCQSTRTTHASFATSLTVPRYRIPTHSRHMHEWSVHHSGLNCTCDDLHMWLAPYSAGKSHVITVRFGRQLRISMVPAPSSISSLCVRTCMCRCQVRLWNYNKSRVHSTRGARLVRWLRIEHAVRIHSISVFGLLVHGAGVDDAGWRSDLRRRDRPCAGHDRRHCGACRVHRVHIGR